MIQKNTLPKDASYQSNFSLAVQLLLYNKNTNNIFIHVYLLSFMIVGESF